MFDVNERRFTRLPIRIGCPAILSIPPRSVSWRYVAAIVRGRGSNSMRRSPSREAIAAVLNVGQVDGSDSLALFGLRLTRDRCQSLANFHQIRSQVPYPRVLHYENIAEDCVQRTAISPGRAHTAFSDYYIVLFNHATDSNGGASHESVILDLFVEGVFSCDVKGSGYHPFNVIGETRQNPHVISLGESVHVLLHGLLIVAHGFVFCWFRDGVPLRNGT